MQIILCVFCFDQEGLNGGQSNPPFHQEGTAELSEDLLEINPLHGKNFRKSAPQVPKKSKKRGKTLFSVVPASLLGHFDSR